METSKLALLYPSKESVKTLQYKDRVTVVMVTYNKYEYIKELIKSFKHLNYDRDLLDIVVVDNNSADGTEEKLKADFGDEITLIQTGANLGGAGGFNTGMKHAIENLDNDYIWLLDNDVVVHPESLNNLMKTIKQDEDRIAAVGSMILQLDNPEYVSEIGAFMDWNKGRVAMQHAGVKYNELLEEQGELKARKVDYCAAASLLKTRKSIEKVGYWEDLFIHFDDVDWCCRAMDKGMEIYCDPESIVFHESMNKKQATWIKYYNVRNLLYLYANHKPLMLPFALAKFSVWAFYFVFHGFMKNSAMAAQAIFDFAFGKKAHQDFPVENYISYDTFDWSKLSSGKHQANGLNFIFHNYENFIDFADELEARAVSVNWDKSNLVVYNLDEEEKGDLEAKFPKLTIVSAPIGGISTKLGLAFAQLSKTLFSNKLTIFDGMFERTFMFPSFAKNIFVYPLYRTVVEC